MKHVRIVRSFTKQEVKNNGINLYSYQISRRICSYKDLSRSIFEDNISKLGMKDIYFSNFRGSAGWSGWLTIGDVILSTYFS